LHALGEDELEVGPHLVAALFVPVSLENHVERRQKNLAASAACTGLHA
jgi:hypothetical protein